MSLSLSNYSETFRGGTMYLGISPHYFMSSPGMIPNTDRIHLYKYLLYEGTNKWVNEIGIKELQRSYEKILPIYLIKHRIHDCIERHRNHWSGLSFILHLFHCHPHSKANYSRKSSAKMQRNLHSLQYFFSLFLW